MSSSNIAESDIAIRTASAVAFALLYYDYALTVGAEIERFWHRSWSAVSFGFFLNRYLSLLGHIPVMYEFYASISQSLCFELQMYHQVLAGVTQVVVGALQVFRIYALYSGNRRVLFLLLGMIAIGCVISGWAICQTWRSDHSDVGSISGRIGCDLTMSQTQGQYLAAVWACILVFDFVVFVLTLYRVLKIGRKWRGSLFTLMLRDGTLYFGVLFVCHLANILTCLVAQPVFRGITVTTTNVLAISLITRLMLHIRDPDFSGRQYRWPSDGMAV